MHKSRYLDRVPDDVLRLIVRGISDTPRAEKWRSTVPGNLLLDVSGPFATVVSPLVNHIALVKDTSNEWARPIPEDAIALNIYDFPNKLNTVFIAFGRALTQLTLQAFPRAGTSASNMVLESMFHRCTSLRSLTIACDMTSMDWNAFSNTVMARIGPQLRSFTFKPIGAFESQVVSCFERLGSSCRALRRFSITMPNRVSLSATLPLWEALGESLREVEIIADYYFPSVQDNDEMWPHIVAHLRDRCRRLISLRIDIQRFFDQNHRKQSSMKRRLADLYASCGDRLRYANLYYITGNNCTKVAHACPKLKADVTVSARHWREICALGARISSLEVAVEHETDADEWPRLRVATALCSELRKFKLVSPGNDHPVYDVFSDAKPTLRDLEFDTPTALLGEDSLKAIAQKSGGLERLVIRTALIENGDAFRQVAFANPSLQYVQITQVIAPGTTPQERVSAEIALCDTIEQFVESPNLCELTFSNHDTWQPISNVVLERFERLVSLFIRKSAVLTVNSKRVS